MRKINVKGSVWADGKYTAFEDVFFVDDLNITVQDIFDMLEDDGVIVNSAKDQESGLCYVRGGHLAGMGWTVPEDDGWSKKVVPLRVDQFGRYYSIAETWE